MYFGSMLKSNKGSSLTLIILIVLVMSSLGVALMSATAYDMRMSAEYSDLNKAYSAAETGVEHIANTLDTDVASIQETARTGATSNVQNLIATNDPSVLGNDESIDDKKVNSEFDKSYGDLFNSGVEDKFGDGNSIKTMQELLNITPVDENDTHTLIEIDNGGTVQLQSAELDSVNSSIKITVIGTYNNSKKQLDVTFNLLSQTSSTPYQVVVKAPLKRTLPGILQKALVAEKNIISAGGSVTINGDVLCFGTVPVDQTGEEDQSAPWYKYGGIIAGMGYEVANNISDTGFDYSDSETKPVAGSIEINGNAATMAYIHSAYSAFSDNQDGSTSWTPSNITIHGDAFARSVKSEQLASYSQLDFEGNVYTTDNLQVDSAGSTVTVGKNYYGFVDAGYFLNGQSVSNTSDESKKDTFQYKRTSSLIVNGDSTVNLNGGVYIGGSTFLKNYTYVDGSNNVIPYMTGISALKSSKKLAEAYFSPDANGMYYYMDNNTGNYATKSSSPREYTEANTLQQQNMIDGISMAERAVHLAGLWNNSVNPWKNDDVFSKYLNINNIDIKLGQDGKLHGFTNGAVLANGNVLTPYDFVGPTGMSHDPNEFLGIQEQCRADFHSAVEPFLDSYSDDGGKLNYTTPVNFISSYINAPSSDIIYNNAGNTESVYYGIGDKNIKKDNNGNWCIDGKLVKNGVICVSGNIYVDDGFNFNGVIMASGNIVFRGNATITYSSTVVNDLLDNDTNINQLFNLDTINNPNSQVVVQSQRFLQKNIKIIDWKEEQIN